jgi:hypothetical protein
MSMISNERTKLAAAYLNGVAIACVAIGGLAPVASVATSSSRSSTWSLSLLVIGCLIISVALHLGARYALRRLIE